MQTTVQSMTPAPQIPLPKISDSAWMKSQPERSVQQRCQICLEDMDHDKIVTAFCGEACAAVICGGCVAQHVRICVDSVPYGLLPQVRCPICLVAVAQSAWQTIVAMPDVTAQYTAACRRACSFLPPCCHDKGYTHLPDATDTSTSSPRPTFLSLLGATALERVRQQTTAFCSHAVSARELITLVEDIITQCEAPLTTQHSLIEHMFPHIADDERRAMLLLTYHAKYRTVATRCCGASVCFNCKRTMSSHDDASCDATLLEDTAILECRSCRVTMVKVEGCSAVQCWCGFAMDWEVELRLRDTHRRKLLGLDPCDVELFTIWQQWQATLMSLLLHELVPLHHALRLSNISWKLSSQPALRCPLRAMLQQYVWRRRFTHMMPQWTRELRSKALVAVMRPSLRAILQHYVWRRRFTRVMQQLVPKWRHEVEIAAMRIRSMADRFQVTQVTNSSTIKFTF